jgi:hypothetical protein
MVGIWSVHLPTNFKLSTDLTWHINYIRCFVPLILENGKIFYFK